MSCRIICTTPFQFQEGWILLPKSIGPRALDECHQKKDGQSRANWNGIMYFIAIRNVIRNQNAWNMLFSINPSSSVLQPSIWSVWSLQRNGKQSHSRGLDDPVLGIFRQRFEQSERIPWSDCRNKILFRLFQQKDTSQFKDALLNSIYPILEKEMKIMSREKYRRYLTLYILCGSISILEAWFKQERKEPSD